MPWSRAPGHRRGVPQAQARRIRERDQGLCQQCGNEGHEIDHRLNVARGGTDDDSNLQLLCVDCHTVKTREEAAAGRARYSRWRDPEEHPGRVRRTTR